MQLFPDVHPATLHTVMSLCKNDFFASVDKLLYAKRCKEIYYSKKNGFHPYDKSNKTQRQCCHINKTYLNSQELQKSNVSTTYTSGNCLNMLHHNNSVETDSWNKVNGPKRYTNKKCRKDKQECKYILIFLIELF